MTRDPVVLIEDQDGPLVWIGGDPMSDLRADPLEAVERATSEPGLGAAWREAEAAIPGNWWLQLKQWWNPERPRDPAPWYAAQVSASEYASPSEAELAGYGPTPEAALRALLRASEQARDLGSEYGRLLAERDRLIAGGVDPSELELPEQPL